MKISLLGKHLFFDEVPHDAKESPTVFLTHSLCVNRSWLKQSAITIYTTTHLASQLHQYAALKKASLPNVVAVQPYEMRKIKFNKQFLEVLFCQSGAISESAMVLIRIDNKLTHFYAGNCEGHNTIYANEVFNKWVQKDHADTLFINLQRAEDLHPVEADVSIKSIENIIESRKDTQVHISVPLLGYAQLLLELVRRLPARIHLTGDLKKMFCSFPETETLNVVDHISKARIIITGDKKSEQGPERLKIPNLFEIMLVESAPNLSISNQDYFEVQWSPLPTYRHLHLLASIVQPATIHDTQSILVIPEYLQKQCVKKEVKPQSHGQATKNKSNPTIVDHHLPVFMRNKNLQFLSDSE